MREVGLEVYGWDTHRSFHWEHCTVWMIIIKDSNSFFYGLKYKVRDRSKIHFWKDL